MVDSQYSVNSYKRDGTCKIIMWCTLIVAFSQILKNFLNQARTSLVPRPPFPFLFGDGGKRVWWISIGFFVLLVPRFWGWLVGVDNHKGKFTFTSLIQSANDEILRIIHNYRSCT